MKYAALALGLPLFSIGCMPAAPAVAPSKASEIEAVHLAGEGPRTLAEAEGKVVIVQFWSTYCDPCRRSFERAEALAREFPDDVVVVAVGLDDPSAEEEVRAFVADNPASFPMVWDRGRVTRDGYRPRTPGATYVVDREGQVRFVHSKSEAGTEETIAREIRSIIAPVPLAK